MLYKAGTKFRPFSSIFWCCFHWPKKQVGI